MLHTADWHLGKLLGDLSRVEEHERFLAFLLEAIREHQIDALLVAGDVFDSAHPPQSAMKLYFDFISKLRVTTACSMVVTSGNHDSPANLDAPRELLAALRVHVVGSLPKEIGETLIPLPDAENPKLVVAAIPFLRDRDLRTGQAGQSGPEIQQLLVAGIEKHYAGAASAGADFKAGGAALLAMGHLTAKGGKMSESEREIHIGGLGTVGAEIFPDAFDYVALGHLHRPQRVGERAEIRYSGSPIPLSFSEADDKKQARVLDFADGKLAGQYPLPLPLTRRLSQWTISRDDLENRLMTGVPPESELRPWVEVIVEDPRPGENLFELVQELAADRPFDVVRVVPKRLDNGAAGLIDELTSETEADDLLRDPKRVFDLRLDDEAALTDDEKAALRTAFDELLELRADREREHPEEATAA